VIDVYQLEARRYVEAVWASGWHALGVQPKDGRYQHVGTFDTPDTWIVAATPYLHSEHHVWLMVNGMAQRPPSRGFNTDITSSRALAMDLDYQTANDAHANENLPTEGQVVRALNKLDDIAPNGVVRTGWGFQPYWLLTHDIDPERRQRLLFAIAARLVDLEPQLWVERLDLAGMFRVPGSTNIKIDDDPQPVVIAHGFDGSRFAPEYLEERCPPVDVPTHSTAARHVPGPITAAQRTLLAYLIGHHGAQGEWWTRDGQIRVTRPDKSPMKGHSANIWMGEDGVAVVTVFSPKWPEIGPEPPVPNRSWALQVDGRGLCHPDDPAAKFTINDGKQSSPNDGEQSNDDKHGEQTDDTASRPLLTWKHAPDPFVVPRIRWLVEGLWCAETHGELAGSEKTLKSTLSTIIDVGLAAGVPVLGQFPVPEAQRVLHLAGEGGEAGYWNRFGRVCDAYGIGVDQVRDQLLVTFGTVSMSNPVFVREVADQLATFGPALTHLDPYYAYSPRGVDSRQLTEVGAALDTFGSLCAQHGSTLLLNNHFNQTGGGNTLTRITGAGHAEWVDSWLLVSHRQEPDVPNGRFRLRLDIGSRQWGGTSWEVDLDLGKHDPATGLHVGAIRWAVRPATTGTPTAQSKHDAKIARAKIDLLTTASKRRKPFQRDALIGLTAGTKTDLRAAFDEMVESGAFVLDGQVRVAAGRGTRNVDVYRVGP
jgi:hypothetical protein